MRHAARGRGGICARVVVPALAVGLMLALGVPSAATALETQERSTTVPFRGEGWRSVIVKCGVRSGRRAISGGFAAPGFDPAGGPQVLTYTSANERLTIPSSPPRGTAWGVHAANHGARAGRLIGYAYCRKGNKLHNRRAVPPPLEPGEQGTASARCPRGTRVVSGGFETSPSLRIYESRKTGPGRWTVSALQTDDERFFWGSGLSPRAYCGPGQATRTRRNRATVAPGLIGRVTASCRRGEKLLSGGFRNANFDYPAGAQLVPHISRKAGAKQRWTVGAHNSGSARGTLVAFAYCRAR